MAISIGVDIGGTKISAAYIVGGEIVATLKCSYNRSRITEDISELYQKLILNREPAICVGVSCAGLVDSSSGVVRFAGNLEMQHFPLGEALESALGIPVRVDNDARCALWGEFSKSQGSFGQNVAGLVLGTGVGGGLIMNGKLVAGKNGFAGEFGHLRVSTGTRTCACGLIGCLESIAGGRSFEENFEAKTGLTLTGEQITDIARAGDLAALEAFQEVGLAVGEVLAQIDTALDLDTVVVGGGFGKTSDLWLDIAKNLYEQALVGSTSRKMLRIVTSQLGQNAQLLGAGALR
jgi:glucokinase